MEEHDIEPGRTYDPALWQFSVRRKDGKWLTRPIPTEGTLVGNRPDWSAVIPDGWRFDSFDDARDAAVFHGADEAQFSVIASPRKPGDWLKQEGDWAPKAA